VACVGCPHTGRCSSAWLIWAQAVAAYSAGIIACPKASAVRLMLPDGSRRGLQAGDLLIEVALLLEVGGHSGCGSVRLKRGSRVASHLEEVSADGVEATIGVDPGIGPKTLD